MYFESPTSWKLLGWIVYIALMAISIWFTWGVFEKFAKQDIAVKQYEEKIEAHPTIAICNFAIDWEYQKDFKIIYTASKSGDEVILGERRRGLLS